jgi:hypothetical protein
VIAEDRWRGVKEWERRVRERLPALEPYRRDEFLGCALPAQLFDVLDAPTHVLPGNFIPIRRHTITQRNKPCVLCRCRAA